MWLPLVDQSVSMSRMDRIECLRPDTSRVASSRTRTFYPFYIGSNIATYRTCSAPYRDVSHLLARRIAPYRGKNFAPYRDVSHLLARREGERLTRWNARLEHRSANATMRRVAPNDRPPTARLVRHGKARARRPRPPRQGSCDRTSAWGGASSTLA